MSACHEITILVYMASTLMVRKISKSPDYLSIQWSFKTYLHHICQTWFLWLTIPLHGVRVSQNQFCSQSSNIWDLLSLYFIISQVKLTPVSKCWGLLALKYTSFVMYWQMANVWPKAPLKKVKFSVNQPFFQNWNYVAWFFEVISAFVPPKYLFSQHLASMTTEKYSKSL